MKDPHSPLMFGRKNYSTKCDLDYTKFKKGNVIEVACEVLMDNNLANPDLFPGMERGIKIQKFMNPTNLFGSSVFSLS